MSETKDDIAAERDALRAENEELRALLARTDLAAAGIAPVPQHRFVLSEGERQELAIRGVVAVGGKLRTADQIRDMLGDDQQDIDLGTATPPPLAGEQPSAGSVPGLDVIHAAGR